MRNINIRICYVKISIISIVTNDNGTNSHNYFTIEKH